MLELIPVFNGLFLGESGGIVSDLSEKFTQMGVSGPKLLSQIILISVVALVLKKFAFGPVQKILAERQRIAQETVDNAEKVKQELLITENTRKEIIQKANEKAVEIIKQAHAAAEVQAQRRLAESLREAERQVKSALEAVEMERAKMEVSLRGEIVRLVADATQRVMGRVLTPEDQDRLKEETVAQVARN
jgi:F-type H+-transporting ATPase subunit b